MFAPLAGTTCSPCELSVSKWKVISFDDIVNNLYLNVDPAKTIISPTCSFVASATVNPVCPTAIDASLTVVTLDCVNAFALAHIDTFKLLPRDPAHLAANNPALPAALPEW